MSQAEQRKSTAFVFERNFEDSIGRLPESYRHDWLDIIQLMNKDMVTKSDKPTFCFLTRKTLDFTFTICNRLRMPNDVRYLAAFLFEKYMSAHMKEVHSFVNSVKLTPEEKRRHWAKAECNISRQMTLRVLSCVQIASKECSYHDSLGTDSVVKVLRHLGTPYTKSAVLKSEIRVLKTVDYQLPLTPLIYLEAPLFQIGSRLHNLALNAVFEHSLLFLDTTLTYADEIYEELLTEGGRRLLHRDFQRRAVAKCKSDWALMGASCIMAAIACVHGMAYADELSRTHADLLPTSPQDVIDLTVVILETVQREHKKKALLAEQRQLNLGHTLLTPAQTGVPPTPPTLHRKASKRRRMQEESTSNQYRTPPPAPKMN